MKKSKKPKILIIGSVPPPLHGTNVYIRELLSSKIRQKFEIKHLDTSDPREDLDNLGKFDLQNIAMGLKNVFQLVTYCIKYKPDIIYLCPAQGNAYWRDGLFIIFSKIFSKTKIIQHLHGSDFHNFFLRSNWIFKRFIDLTQEMVDRTIVLGSSLKQIFSRWHNEQKIDVVPNGIDLNIFIKKKHNNSGLPVLYFLGNLLKFKGIHIAIEALAFVKNKFPDIQIKIAGPWTDDSFFKETKEQIRSEITEIIKRKNLNDCIEFIGPFSGNEKLEILKNVDILVYPSINDGLPLVILEAMAAGNVVITSKNIGAIPDVVVHNETGILVDGQNSEKFAEAIIYLIENPEIRVRMGKAAYSRYESLYTFEKHINNMISVFNSFLEES
jgi:glycosyltransferase involved in cell wall biosynthesis